MGLTVEVEAEASGRDEGSQAGNRSYFLGLQGALNEAKQPKARLGHKNPTSWQSGGQQPLKAYLPIGYSWIAVLGCQLEYMEYSR